MSSKTISLLFYLSLLVTIPFLNLQPANSAVTSFFWLKPETHAVYSYVGAMLGFDDHGWADPVRGNYSWLCLEVNDTHTILDVEVNIEVYKKPGWVHPGYITYTGIEFLEMAARGDLSFIRRVPMDQVIGRVELSNRTTPGDEYYAVNIPSPIFISQEFTVVVDLDTMEMIDEKGEPWGRWTLWIDPLQYPLEGQTEEVFIKNWLNTTVFLNVTYKAPPNSIPDDTIFGEVKRYFSATTWQSIENEFLLELGVLGLTGIKPCYHYEARTGIFLNPTLFDYLDDILTQKFGIILTHLEYSGKILFYLSSIAFHGDLNTDWAVDILDVAIVAGAFGSKPGDDRWNQTADRNKDEIINILDVTTVALAFGTQYVTTE